MHVSVLPNQRYRFRATTSYGPVASGRGTDSQESKPLPAALEVSGNVDRRIRPDMGPLT
jgi:hypothetical protein